MDYDIVAQDAVRDFKAANENMNIEVKTFQASDYEEFYHSIKAGLQSGKGPDIILFDPYNFTELAKYMEKGFFADLNELIDKDKEFKLSDFNEKILESGVYKGKRFLIPTGYTIDAFVAESQAAGKGEAGKYTIKLDESGISFKDFVKEAEKYMESNKEENNNEENKGKYLIPSLDFLTILRNTKTSYINYDEKKTSFDTPEFIELLSSYNKLKAWEFPKDKTGTFPSAKELVNLLKEKEAAVFEMQLMNPRWMKNEFSNIKTTVNIYPSPSAGTDGCISATPSQYIGINSQSTNKKAAFEFVKHMLSIKYQADANHIFIPVRNEAYKKNLDEAMKAGEAVKSILRQMDAMVQNIGTCSYMDGEVRKIINEELEALSGGNKSAEEAAQSMKERVEGYLESDIEEAKAGSQGDSKNDSQGDSNKADASDSEYDITIYAFSSQYNILTAASDYQDKHPDMRIKIEEFSRREPENPKIRLATELMSGKGPDVIAFDRRYFDSLYKAATSGAFYDLNELMSKDTKLNMADFNPELMKWGVYNGKRYFVPLSANARFICSTKEALDANKIKLENCSLKEFGDIVKRYMEENRGENAYFFDSDFTFRDILNASGLKIIDYENKQTFFKTKEFIDLMVFFKDINETVLPKDVEKNIIDIKLINEGKLVACMDYIGSFKDLWTINSNFKSLAGGELIFYPIPTYRESSDILVTFREGAAINSAAKNKEAAYEIVKLLMSLEMHNASGYKVISGFPVNKRVFVADRAENVPGKSDSSNFYAFGEDGSLMEMVQQHPLSEELALEFEEMMERFKPAEIIDEEVYRMIEQAESDFISGKKTAEQAAEELDNMVTLYLNE